MKRRIIFVIISLMMLLPCAKLSAQTSGKVYLEPFVGGTISPNRGVSVGLSVGYVYDYGLAFEGTFGYRDLSGYNLAQFSAGIKYECPYIYLGYPIIGCGAGFIVDFPRGNYGSPTIDPTVNYKFGYAFYVVPDYLDIGLEYRGDAIFMLDQTNGRLWGTLVEHSLCLTFRVYLTR